MKGKDGLLGFGDHVQPGAMRAIAVVILERAGADVDAVAQEQPQRPHRAAEAEHEGDEHRAYPVGETQEWARRGRPRRICFTKLRRSATGERRNPDKR